MPSIDSKQATPQIIAPSLFGSCRLSISLVLMLGSFVAFFIIATLNFAIVCVNQNKNANNNSRECTSNILDESPSCAALDDKLFWNKTMQGLLLGASFFGVASTQILIGYFSDKYGHCKLQMLVGALVLSLANILSPFVIIYLGNYYFFVLRILMGMAMTSVVLSILNMVRHWATPRDQGLLVGLSMGGLGFAMALNNPIAAAMCYYGGWRSIFYLPGACGLLWFILGFFLLCDNPNKHPRISVEERQYLEMYGLTSKKNEDGIYSALPAVGLIIVRFIIGPIFDYIRSKNLFSLTNLRKIFHTMGTLIPAIMMFGVSQTGPDRTHLILPFIITGVSFAEATHIAGFGIVLLDIAPNHMGILEGINNTIGLTPGIIVPLVIAALTPKGTLEEWGHVYLLFGCLFLISFLVFTFTGNARRQKWAETEEIAVI